ncbi:hypothetical protein DLAC_05504 [Tieghemostelium lacteum]|uniref:C2H2-type domain-containing protein n=1 Tax=Tieghemostelium lacteum TaxID=361077 RepID=A0A151ZG13_TIELA|nr:hypothetical protein DLAC_05504 [Tieghemostelium lacteum]|eukprot:KYQ92911.1 hypothetical protein DLAC_05504 [Tieghemostelium lacteum]
MGRYSGHGGTHTKNKQYKRARAVKNRAKDIDQIYEELQPGKLEKHSKFEVDPDLPGLGQHFCIHCSKHFQDDKALQTHFKSKPHKRRLTLLKEKPYTVEDSQIPIDNGPKLRNNLLQSLPNSTSPVSTESTAAMDS